MCLLLKKNCKRWCFPQLHSSFLPKLLSSFFTGWRSRLIQSGPWCLQTYRSCGLLYWEPGGSGICPCNPWCPLVSGRDMLVSVSWVLGGNRLHFNSIGKLVASISVAKLTNAAGVSSWGKRLKVFLAPSAFALDSSPEAWLQPSSCLLEMPLGLKCTNTKFTVKYNVNNLLIYRYKFSLV